MPDITVFAPPHHLCGYLFNKWWAKTVLIRKCITRGNPAGYLPALRTTSSGGERPGPSGHDANHNYNAGNERANQGQHVRYSPARGHCHVQCQLWVAPGCLPSFFGHSLTNMTSGYIVW